MDDRLREPLLTHYGYLEETGCAKATLCPALSLPDLFSTSDQTGAPPNLTQAQISSLLSAVPTYFSQAVITPDHREATLAFGIRLMPLSRQQQVIDYMQSHLHPPPGVTAALAGLPVLAAQADAALSSAGHRFLTLIVSLLAVGLVLLIVLRRVARAVVPMIPIVLATGWSSLVLFAIGIPLNPMSATLGTLVIAISTEFSVLLSERFHQERARRAGARGGARRTYRSTGAAVMASGRDRDRRLRRAGLLRHHDAARFRVRDPGGPDACRWPACCCVLPGRADAGRARTARAEPVRRAPRARRAATLARAAAPPAARVSPGPGPGERASRPRSSGWTPIAPPPRRLASRAARGAGPQPPPAGPRRPSTPGRYRWMIGIFGLAWWSGSPSISSPPTACGTTGVPPGQRLHLFAAPLAATDLNGVPNLNPPCTLAAPRSALR